MEYLYCIALGWFLVEFEPFQMLIDYLFELIKKPHPLLNYFRQAFNCNQCMILWSGWILTGSFFTALVSSFIWFVYESWMHRK